MNASVNPGCHDITSSTSSGRSTRGTIASTRRRRSISDGGSGTAFNAATCSLPSSSTVAAVSSSSREITSR